MNNFILNILGLFLPGGAEKLIILGIIAIPFILILVLIIVLIRYFWKKGNSNNK